MFCLAVLINQGNFAPTKLTYNKMKKILFAISTMALLLCACSEDEKDPTLGPSDSEIDYIGEFMKENNLHPNQLENINSIGKLLEINDYKILLGQKNYNAWIAKFDNNGNEVNSFELSKLANWKYSYYNSKSELLINNNLLFLKGWHHNSSKIFNITEGDYDERTSIFDLKTWKEVDYFTYNGNVLSSNYNVYIYLSNNRYLIIKDPTFMGKDVFYVVGENGKILYNREWSDKEEMFFHNRSLIFLNDEIVSPVIPGDFSYQIINLKKWESIKKIGEDDGLKPFGDRIDQEGIFYTSDTTFLEGNKIKFVYSEQKTIKDEISGSLEYIVLDRYYYYIDINTYEVSYMGKIK